MNENPDSENKVSAGQEYMKDYFKGLTTIIDARARAIAQEQGRNEPQTRDIAQACAEIAPGNPFPKEQTFWQRIGSTITGITIISAILAVIFGTIGFAGLRWGGEQGAQTVQAFIDISQIFAGAVVGSTGATAISNR